MSTERMKVIVYIKGKAKPMLFEAVEDCEVRDSGTLAITFTDGSQCLLAEGQWREADINPTIVAAMTLPPEVPDVQ